MKSLSYRQWCLLGSARYGNLAYVLVFQRKPVNQRACFYTRPGIGLIPRDHVATGNSSLPKASQLHPTNCAVVGAGSPRPWARRAVPLHEILILPSMVFVGIGQAWQPGLRFDLIKGEQSI